MGDSGSEHSDGSDNEDDLGGFDPTRDMEKLSDKERKKWDKRLQQWRIFTDFIFRHVSIVTYKFNQFEKDELTSFMIALEKAESIRASMKLKKTEHPRISSYKMMKEASELLKQHKFLAESNRIKDFLNIAGRMRGLGMIAGGYFKAMKKAKLKGIDKIKHYMDYWKGFTVRSFDYGELTFKNTEPDTFNALERKYLVWPTVVKTAINLSQKFLKKTSDSSGLELLNADYKLLQKYMAAPEFVIATKIEDDLFDQVEQGGAKNFLLGLGNPLGTTAQPVANTKYDLPPLGDIDQDLLKPIPDTGTLLELPHDPPKEKKKGKKGKKGKGKGKGRSHSASSHKGGKKKKKKK